MICDICKHDVSRLLKYQSRAGHTVKVCEECENGTLFNPKTERHYLYLDGVKHFYAGETEPIKMKVVIKIPGNPAQIAEIENGLRSLQKFVGGYIETVDFINDTVLICNEEGKLEGLSVNFHFGSDIIVGPVVICGIDGEDFGSLSDDETERVLRHLNN